MRSEVVEFWMREDAFQDRTEAQRRAYELVYVVRNDNQNIVGACTTELATSIRLQRLFIFCGSLSVVLIGLRDFRRKSSAGRDVSSRNGPRRESPRGAGLSGETRSSHVLAGCVCSASGDGNISASMRISDRCGRSRFRVPEDRLRCSPCGEWIVYALSCKARLGSRSRTRQAAAAGVRGQTSPAKKPCGTGLETPPPAPAAAIWSTWQMKERPDIQKRSYKGVLWSPSYLASSCGGTPISIVRQYIEQQASH